MFELLNHFFCFENIKFTLKQLYITYGRFFISNGEIYYEDYMAIDSLNSYLFNQIKEFILYV